MEIDLPETHSIKSEDERPKLFLYIEDLLVSTKTEPLKFDYSFLEEDWIEIQDRYDAHLVRSTEEPLECLGELKKAFKMPSLEVEFLSLKEALEQTRKNSISRIAVSDKFLANEAQSIWSEILASGQAILFMSLFSDNDDFKNQELANVELARGAGVLLSKLQYSHIKGRTKFGICIESKYYKPALIKIFEDSEEIEFIPITFNEVPQVNLDYLLHRITNFQAKVQLSNDQKAQIQMDNYLSYEDKHKKTVYIDKFYLGKICCNRSDFMEVLKTQCDEENEVIGKEVFDIPWTRQGDYLDVFSNPNPSDPVISKILRSIPYPLMTKMDIACGDPATHTFIYIKEKPLNWEELKEKIQQEYHQRDFIIQSYFKSPNNIVVKSVNIFDNFSYKIQQGFGSKVTGLQSGEKLLNTEAERKKLNLASTQAQTYDSENPKAEENPSKIKKNTPTLSGNGSQNQEPSKLNDCSKLSPKVPEPLPVADIHLPKHILERIRAYHMNIAKTLRLKFMGIDYLVDIKKDLIRPIDVNKMPRLEEIPDFREILASHVRHSRVTKNSST